MGNKVHPAPAFVFPAVLKTRPNVVHNVKHRFNFPNVTLNPLPTADSTQIAPHGLLFQDILLTLEVPLSILGVT